MKLRHRVLPWSGVVTLVAGSLVGGVMTLTASGPASASVERAPRECTNANLTASYHYHDAATSHVYGRIVLRNTSRVACWIRGYGGLSYVGGGDGTQVGAPADRTRSRKPKVVLTTGEKVRSTVVETSAAAYPKRRCKPRRVDGFRIYIPDETRSQYVAHPTVGCTNPAIHLLSHKAYR